MQHKPGTEKGVPIGAKLQDGPNALDFDYLYGYTHARNIIGLSVREPSKTRKALREL